MQQKRVIYYWIMKGGEVYWSEARWQVGSKNTQRLQFSPPPVRNPIHYLYYSISNPALSTQREWRVSSKALQVLLPFSFNISTPTIFNTVRTNMQPLISTVLCKQNTTFHVLPIAKNQIEQRYRSNLDLRNHSQTGLPMQIPIRILRTVWRVSGKSNWQSEYPQFLTDKHNSTSVPTTHSVLPLQRSPLLTYLQNEGERHWNSSNTLSEDGRNFDPGNTEILTTRPYI